jgi:hypothetical protein
MRPQRTLAGLALATTALLAVASPAMAAGNGDQASRKPVFGPALYADGALYGTNLNAPLPAPTDATRHSYDVLYVFTNAGQMPVAEAAPGPDYNGGRWIVHQVTWADDAVPTTLTSDEAILAARDAGLLTITETDTAFSCPLLPVKA